MFFFMMEVLNVKPLNNEHHGCDYGHAQDAHHSKTDQFLTLRVHFIAKVDIVMVWKW